VEAVVPPVEDVAAPHPADAEALEVEVADAAHRVEVGEELEEEEVGEA